MTTYLVPVSELTRCHIPYLSCRRITYHFAYSNIRNDEHLVVSTLTRETLVCVCVFVCVCVCVCVCACVCARIIKTNVCLHVCMYAFLHVCMYVRRTSLLLQLIESHVVSRTSSTRVAVPETLIQNTF